MLRINHPYRINHPHRINHPYRINHQYRINHHISYEYRCNITPKPKQYNQYQTSYTYVNKFIEGAKKQTQTNLGRER